MADEETVIDTNEPAETEIDETKNNGGETNKNCCHCCCKCNCGSSTEAKKESLIRSHWRPIAAAVYLTICLFDFIAMPIVIEIHNREVDPVVAVSEALKFKESSAQTQALQILSKKRSWDPLTLMGAGTFHIAFGALLSAAAWTRGQEKIENLKQNGASGSSDSDRDALLRERLARRQAALRNRDS